MGCKRLGTAPGEAGDSPEFTENGAGLLRYCRSKKTPFRLGEYQHLVTQNSRQFDKFC